MKNDTFTLKELMERSYDMLESQHKKIDNLTSEISDVKIHLKELNGKAARNVVDISRNKEEIEQTNKQLEKVSAQQLKWIGAISVIVVIGSMVVSILF